MIARCKVAKDFRIDIADGRLAWRRDQKAIDAEARLDGICVIRTSEPETRLSADDTVRTYKALAEVERPFRTLEGLDILIRPIRHRDERRVRAHIFLCLFAADLEWHLRRAWAPILFHDDTLDVDRATRDPVAPARSTVHARRKKASRRSEDGWPLHSFDTLIADLATRCRNTCRFTHDPDTAAFDQITQPTKLQSHALDLIKTFPVEDHANI